MRFLLLPLAFSLFTLGKTGTSAVQKGGVSADSSVGALTFGRHCVGCHAVDKLGGLNLRHVAAPSPILRDTSTLRRWIENPKRVADTQSYARALVALYGQPMPGFDSVLTGAEIGELIRYLQSEHQR